MVVLITGSRHWNQPWQRKIMIAQIRRLPPKSTVIHGAAPGADTMAGNIAKMQGHFVRPYPAEWDRYGRAAGVIRNQFMLDDNTEIEKCLAFHADLANSKGTADMIKRCHKAGIPVEVYPRRKK